MELLLQTHPRIPVDLQRSSFPTPMRQEPSTAILTDIHSLFSRTVTETGWILTEIPIAFADEQDAYDANGNSYYWHGEAADVYYMPVQ